MRRSILLAWLGLAACGQAAVVADGGIDASSDGTTNDASSNDATPDAVVPTDAGVLDVQSKGACALSTGDCWDYFGSSWTQSTAAGGCNAEAGATLTWNASCPTANRTGSCVEATGAFAFVERCYPPVTTQQCQGICAGFDGGFYPN